MKRLYKYLIGHWDRLRTETRWGRVIYGALDNYGLHGCTFMAAGLSFYAMISLIPLAFVFFWLMTKLLIKGDNLERMRMALDAYLLPEVADTVHSQVANISDANLIERFGAWIGVVFFVWAGIRFYETLQFIMARAWGATTPQRFFKRKLVTVLAFLGAGGFIALTISATTALTELAARYPAFFGFELGRLYYVLAHILSFAIAILMFFLAYTFMTGRIITSRIALATAIPVGIVWELTKRLFTSVIATGSTQKALFSLPTEIATSSLHITEKSFYNIVYGQFASFVLLMVWVYMSSTILLMGAEFGAAWLREFRPHKSKHQAS